MRTRNKQINLDRANGAAENASKEEATMRNASKKTPWHLRLAGNMKTAAAAVVVGIGLLAGSTGDVHAQSNCYPPIFDVCLHNSEGRWESSFGLFEEVEIEFEGKQWQLYEVVWHGLKEIGGNKTYADVSRKPSLCGRFCCDSLVRKLLLGSHHSLDAARKLRLYHLRGGF